MAGFDLGRTDGMMLAVAIGDALGSTTESLTPADRVRMHGEIRDDLVNRHAGGRRMGYPPTTASWPLRFRRVPRGLMEVPAIRCYGRGTPGTSDPLRARRSPVESPLIPPTPSPVRGPYCA